MLAVLAEGDPSGRPILGEAPEPRAGAGEVLVRVRATAVNQADRLQLRGLYPPPPGESEIPGLECAGVVVEAGSGAQAWKPGARVMALVGGGGQAEKVVVPAGQLLAIPEGLSFAEAAAVPESALTAWTNLVAEGGLEAEEAVLVTAATGGVGSFAVQLARELGATVFAAGRDPERLERLGVGEPVLEDDSLAEHVRRRTGGRGVDLVLDLVGGAHLDEHLAALAPGGRLVLVGLMAGWKSEIDLSRILRRRLRVVGSVLRPRPRGEKAELVRACGEFLLPRLADGRIRPLVHRIFPFTEIAQAYTAMAEGGVLGKIVVEL